jgi:hypothetical protein
MEVIFLPLGGDVAQRQSGFFSQKKDLRWQVLFFNIQNSINRTYIFYQ